MANPEPTLKEMPALSQAENARRDAEARREFEAGEGIPEAEVRAWLKARMEGQDVPLPKARKLF